MKVNIRSESGSWILPKCARAIRDASPTEIRWDQEGPLWTNPQIEHGINWGYLQVKPNVILTAQFNHYNPAVGADLFADRVRLVDKAIVISEGARFDVLRFGIPERKIALIELGVDAVYRPRLVLGVVGRCYEQATLGKDIRKGRSLLLSFLADSWVAENVTVRIMGEGWLEPGSSYGGSRVQQEPFNLERLPAFYATLDYLLCTSTFEGGPVPMLEALAMGIQTIIPRIGYAHTLPHVEYKAGNLPSLLYAVRMLLSQKRAVSAVNHSLVEGWTWKRWGERHVELFRALVDGAR